MITKLRAWIESDKKLYEVTEVNYAESTIKVLTAILTDVVTKNREMVTKTVDMSDAEIVSSTGKVDKNGREIFEGDLVATGEKLENKGLVYFCKEKGDYRLKGYANWPIYDISSDFLLVIGDVFRKKP